MASAVQYAVLLLTLAMSLHVECGKIPKNRCASQPPCFDIFILERLARHVSRDVVSTDSENILLKSQTFDKIRKKKYLHSCVLRKIIDFYEKVLANAKDNSTNHYISHGMNYHLELISLMDKMRSCAYKMNESCEVLYQKAVQQPTLKILEADMTPVDAAIHQLQKLNFASEKLNDLSVQEKAMDELKSLHNYIPGRGFRKTNDARKKTADMTTSH